MNKSEIISGLEDLVRSTKSSLDNSPSDDIFLHDIAVLSAAIVVIEKYVPGKPFMNPMNLYSLLMRCENQKERMAILREGLWAWRCLGGAKLEKRRNLKKGFGMCKRRSGHYIRKARR